MIYLLLFLTGTAAGFINTLAGGGSTLTLPVLILSGLSSPIANATNRVAILIQNITAVSRFKKHGKLQIRSVLHITSAAIIGAVIGSFFAIKVDSELFDKILGVVFIIILLMMIRKPGKKRSTRLPRWIEFIIFLGVGFYGGFIQAGVGFIFLATLNLIEHYDLISANAVKVFIILCYTAVAVLIFALSDKIVWQYGLVMAAGNSLGAFIGVRTAVIGGEKIIKTVLIAAITIACLKLFGVQLLGVVAVFAWTLLTGFILFKILKATVGLRVDREEELRGLDISEHGMEAYSGFQIFITQ